jgi:CRISPR-associated protein Csm2
VAYNDNYNKGNNYSKGRPNSPYQAPVLPKDYLVDGYYEVKNGKQVLKCEYILEFAKQISKNFIDGNKNKSSQLRKFYDYCMRLQQTLATGNDFAAIQADFSRLVPFVEYAKTRGRVTPLFVDFIKQNVAAVKNKEDYRAFVKHFEAIVAYLPKDKN